MARALLAATALALVLNAPGGAQERERIVVTGSAVEVGQGEALTAVEVISLETLEEGAIGGLGDTLAKLPGVSTTSFGAAASRPIIRGLGGDRVRVLTNGVGLVDASAVSPDHAVTSEVLEAERVEILRGPAAIAYGGGAVGGVVNVVDGRVPEEGAENNFESRLFAGLSSVDEGSQLGARARMFDGPFVLQIDGSRRDAGDYDIPGFAKSALRRALDGEDGPSGTVTNSGYTFETLGLGGSFVGERGFGGLAFKDYDAEYGLQPEEEGEPGGHIEMEQQRLDARAQLDVAFLGFEHIDLAAGSADYEHTEFEGSGEPGTIFTNDGWEARAALVRGAEAGAWSGVVGVQALNKDFAAVGEEAFIPPVTTKDAGLFAATRYDAGGWGIEAGARVETRDIDPQGAASRSFDTSSLSGGVFARPRDNLFLAASLSRVERAPTDGELYADGPHLATSQFEVGDPGLGKETAWALDTTARVTAARWSGEVGVFAAQYKDFIYLAPTDLEEDGLPVFTQLQDDATLTGFDGAVRGDLATLGAWDLRSDMVFEFVRGETDGFGDLPRMPPFSATWGLEAETERLTLRGEVVHTVEQDRTADFEPPTDGFTMANLSAVSHPFSERDVRLILGIDNVTDEEGRVHASALKDTLPLPGRNFRLAVSAAF